MRATWPGVRWSGVPPLTVLESRYPLPLCQVRREVVRAQGQGSRQASTGLNRTQPRRRFPVLPAPASLHTTESAGIAHHPFVSSHQALHPPPMALHEL
jgi:hypothetical protein